MIEQTVVRKMALVVYFIHEVVRIFFLRNSLSVVFTPQGDECLPLMRKSHKVPQIKLHAEHLWSKSLHSPTLSFFIPGRTPATAGSAWQAEIACLRAIY